MSYHGGREELTERGVHMRFRYLLMLLALVMILVAIPLASPRAATGFADPAFQQQWTRDEATLTNFYGPLMLAHDKQSESYGGGMRTVQYFDKARLELGANGTVTSGLLATELVTGKLQTGDATFDPRTPPAIPIAGDPTGPGPKYADFTGKAAPVLAPATSAVGKSVTVVLAADGTPSTGTPPSGDATPYAIAAFDDATKHNVPAAFDTLRTKVGLTTVGYAISEPFLLNVGQTGKVATMAQIFQRRVMTYTPANADPYKVEFGNIGAHYYQWRYATPAMGTGTAPAATSATASATTATGTGTASATATGATAATANGTFPAIPTLPGTPTPTAAPATPKPAPDTTLAVTFKDITASAKPGDNATANVTTTAGASCVITVVYKNGPSAAAGLNTKTADSTGAVSWTWVVDKMIPAGKYPVTVACSLSNNVGSAQNFINVTG